MVRNFTVAALALIGLSIAVGAQPLSNQQIAERIIHESRNAYYATGRPCACPDDHMRNGRMCGKVSAYVRPGGASPKCYPQDVTAADIAAYRAHPTR